MAQVPPPKQPMSTNKVVGIVLATIGSFALVAILGIWFVFNRIQASGITRPMDNIFGDQHLKTSVALIELHKTRFGTYPSDLSELKFVGQWDVIHLQTASYCANEDRTAYFIEVRRGWIGKPSLDPEDGFWEGTGYRAELGPCD